jgi:capsular polysaccharide biosynthesis protein
MSTADRYAYDEKNYIREVSLLDLCREIVKKWLIILIAALVLAVLAAGYSVLKNKRRQSSMDQAYAKYEEAMVTYNTQLETLQKQLRINQAQVDNSNIYAEKSVLMNLDPYNVSMSEAILTITFDDAQNRADSAGGNMGAYKAQQAYTLMLAYSSYITETIPMDALAQELGIDEAYLRELIKVTYSPNTQSQVMNLIIYGRDTAMAEKIRDFILENLDGVEKNLETQYGTHEVTVLSKSTKQGVDLNLKDSQTSTTSAQTSLTKSLTNLQTTIAALDKPSYSAPYSTSTLIKQAVTMAVFGFLGGAVLMALFLAVRIIMAGTLMSAGELSRKFGLKCLGCPGPTRDQYKLICAQIENYMKNRDSEGAGRILFISTLENKRAAAAVKEMRKCESEMLIFDLASSVTARPDSIRKIADYDACVLLEEVHVSRYADIVRLLEILGDSDKTLIGTVILGA